MWCCDPRECDRSRERRWPHAGACVACPAQRICRRDKTTCCPRTPPCWRPRRSPPAWRRWTCRRCRGEPYWRRPSGWALLRSREAKRGLLAPQAARGAWFRYRLCLGNLDTCGRCRAVGLEVAISHQYGQTTRARDRSDENGNNRHLQVAAPTRCRSQIAKFRMQILRRWHGKLLRASPRRPSAGRTPDRLNCSLRCDVPTRAPPRRRARAGQALPFRHTRAVRQQLGHDPARRVHAGVRQDRRIAIRRAFRHRARHQLAVALGQIGVARLL